MDGNRKGEKGRNSTKFASEKINPKTYWSYSPGIARRIFPLAWHLPFVSKH
jgi:hypothetical protein